MSSLKFRELEPDGANGERYSSKSSNYECLPQVIHYYPAFIAVAELSQSKKFMTFLAEWSKEPGVISLDDIEHKLAQEE